jgi:ABC-type bacteriocin/lantibiotic exporter with double-glycine peptidase domain
MLIILITIIIFMILIFVYFFKREKNKLKNYDEYMDKFYNRRIFLMELLKEIYSENLKDQIKSVINELEELYKKNLNYLKKADTFSTKMKFKKELKHINKEMSLLINKLISHRDQDIEEIDLNRINHYIDLIKEKNKKDYL